MTASFTPDKRCFAFQVRGVNRCNRATPYDQQLNIILTLPSLPGLRELARCGDGETLHEGGEPFPFVCRLGLPSKGLLGGVGLLLCGVRLLLRDFGLLLRGAGLLLCGTGLLLRCFGLLLCGVGLLRGAGLLRGLAPRQAGEALAEENKLAVCNTAMIRNLNYEKVVKHLWYEPLRLLLLLLLLRL
jgi:hypothetical protein